MSPRAHLALVFAVVVLVAFPTAQSPAPLNDAAIEQFLLKAKVVSTRPAGKGVTDSLRATLSDGTLTHDAQIQTVDDFKPVYRTRTAEERNFRDSWRFNVAAYKIDRLLGLHLVPVSVQRRWGTAQAAFTWWLDDIIMDEEGRQKREASPPEPQRWAAQMRLIRLFDQLIDNVDRNQGNILISKTWQLWAIDHTRAFRYSREPRRPEHVTTVDAAVVERLRTLDLPTLKREIGRYVTDDDLRNLLARRDAMVKLLAAQPDPGRMAVPTPAAPAAADAR